MVRMRVDKLQYLHLRERGPDERTGDIAGKEEGDDQGRCRLADSEL